MRRFATVKSKMSKYIGIMYKIKRHLPMKSRLQIFHSFVQSHLNFCSLVWGFAAKTYIETLFAEQKKAMRAIMPGYVNYFYNDGQKPAHTKQYFNKYDILTVHGIIVKNSLNFMHRVNHFPNSYPQSIVQTIPSNAPCAGSDHNHNYNNCVAWLDTYGNTGYRTSVFYKGPLLTLTPHYIDSLTTASFLSYKSHLNIVKQKLLDLQTVGDEDSWPNFIIYSIPGLRKSNRLNS